MIERGDKASKFLKENHVTPSFDKGLAICLCYLAAIIARHRSPFIVVRTSSKLEKILLSGHSEEHSYKEHQG